jgi:hypothetical protein
MRPSPSRSARGAMRGVASSCNARDERVTSGEISSTLARAPPSSDSPPIKSVAPDGRPSAAWCARGTAKVRRSGSNRWLTGSNSSASERWRLLSGSMPPATTRRWPSSLIEAKRRGEARPWLAASSVTCAVPSWIESPTEASSVAGASAESQTSSREREVAPSSHSAPGLGRESRPSSHACSLGQSRTGIWLCVSSVPVPQ